MFLFIEFVCVLMVAIEVICVLLIFWFNFLDGNVGVIRGFVMMGVLLIGFVIF